MELQVELSQLYLHTCKLDVQSLKPGNVSVYSTVKDLSVDDFLNSAAASVQPLTEQNISLGKRILRALEATHKAVSTNTNLGMILLIAPLIHARLQVMDSSEILNALKIVLKQTTIEDACDVYQAIRLANPGGMGKKNNQDISEEPSVSLLKTMEISASWDQIAAQYTNNFADIFNFGVPLYKKLLEKWQDEKWATSGLFLSFLAHYPDSLIERKFGLLKAKEISAMISGLERELCRSDSPGRYEAQLLEIDSHLKRNRINPGTTADLTVASVFAAGIKQLRDNS